MPTASAVTHSLGVLSPSIHRPQVLLKRSITCPCPLLAGRTGSQASTGRDGDGLPHIATSTYQTRQDTTRHSRVNNPTHLPFFGQFSSSQLSSRLIKAPAPLIHSIFQCICSFAHFSSYLHSVLFHSICHIWNIIISTGQGNGAPSSQAE